MRITETALAGAFLVELEPHRDERGFFARTFCVEEFASAGLPTRFPQCNLSVNTKAGTLRGMHYQGEPAPEGKLVRCSRGRIFDVIVDLRPASPTHRQWRGFELSAANGSALYIPPGFAHGFQTLEDGSDVFYQMTVAYHPQAQGGVRWNDPAFAIRWPLPDPMLSPRDQAYPDYAG